MTRTPRILAILVLSVLLGASLGFGQTTATLTGNVTMDGAPLPGVTVNITSPSMQGTRTSVTDVNGNYNFGALPPGLYTVKFEMESMQTVTKQVNVGLTTTTRANADMKLSAVAEAITVTASAPAVLETTEVQTNITGKLIEDLPIGRTLLSTVNLAPGVNSNGPAGATTISGSMSYDSTFTVDGAVVNEVLRGQPQNLFIEDAIQETTVQTGAISAEYGRFTGGVVTAISKSGGNEFSGSLRDSMLNASWTAQGELKEARPADEIVSIYEGTFGGRIVRDRLWFFTAGRYYDYSADRFFSVIAGSGETPLAYSAGDTETRLEGKLTGQITPKHSVTGSYFDISREQTNNAFGSILEPLSLDKSRELPNTFATINYSGVLSSNLLVEALYARQDFSFVGSGADAPASPERGTNIFQGDTGQRSGYPTFCGACSFPEERNNSNGKLKASYYLSSASLGTHNVSAGYEYYEDMLKSDNHQSASDFTFYTYSYSLLDSHEPDGAYLSRGANGELLHSMPNGGGFIVWWPILESAKGNSFKTSSIFLNDKWDLNTKLSFNLGVRYDQNKGVDNSGVTVADDSNFSPRLGMTYDIFGNGRLRANASYSVYASKIANGNVGDNASPAGSPSILYWLYYGPDLNNLTSDQMLDQVFSWFNSVGGTDNQDFLLGGGTSGIATRMAGTLKSPQVREYSIGLGSQIGSNGFVRADYQDREWSNFYTDEVSMEIGTVFDPLAGSNLDLTLTTNSDDFTRKYKAVLLQGGYRMFNRLNLGGNYTWSELKGNIAGETSGSGPVTAGGSNYYREFTGFAQNNPIGLLSDDATHKLRAWAAYDLPTPIGAFNFSLLQRFDSGTAYSAVATVNPTRRAACPTCPANPGYIDPPTAVNYYFTERGAFRTDDITATDLSVNYELPIHNVRLFAQAELINAFNNQGVTSPNTSVTVLRSFNPFTDTPQECPQGTATATCLANFPTGGVWRKGVNFGKGLNPTTGASLLPGGSAGSYQLPRTYRFSLGVRF